MIAGIALLLAAAAAAQPTDETFTVGRTEFDGPCHVTVEGKPNADPPATCAAAIAAAPTAKQKAILYFAWAYSLNEVDATLQALPNLDQAVALAPNFGNARHERSYTLNDLGLYARALVDSDRDVAISSQSPGSYQERGFARRRLADFAGSLADALKAIELGGTSYNLEIEVVRNLMWLGRYDEAAKRLAGLPDGKDQDLRADLKRRLDYRPDGAAAARCDMKKMVDDRAVAQKLVDDCTWAFDHEKGRAKQADYLTVRSVMSVTALQDRDSNVSDLLIASALDPANPERHINYGNALIGVRHSWAARNEFEIALSASNLGNRDKALALAGRGRARLNLGELAGAKSDVKASFQIEPSYANAWLAGDVAFADGNKEAAKKFWLLAYRMGPPDDSLRESLKSVGVDDPAKEAR
jgi:tetratricopeptide (TPR) repeat protein